MLTRSRSRPRRGEELRQRQDAAACPPPGIAQRVQAEKRLVRNLERQFMEKEAARAKAAAHVRAAWTLPAPSHQRDRDGPQQADAEAAEEKVEKPDVPAQTARDAADLPAAEEAKEKKKHHV